MSSRLEKVIEERKKTQQPRDEEKRQLKELQSQAEEMEKEVAKLRLDYTEAQKEAAKLREKTPRFGPRHWPAADQGAELAQRWHGTRERGAHRWQTIHIDGVQATSEMQERSLGRSRPALAQAAELVPPKRGSGLAAGYELADPVKPPTVSGGSTPRESFSPDGHAVFPSRRRGAGVGTGELLYEDHALQ